MRKWWRNVGRNPVTGYKSRWWWLPVAACLPIAFWFPIGTIIYGLIVGSLLIPRER